MDLLFLASSSMRSIDLRFLCRAYQFSTIFIAWVFGMLKLTGGDVVVIDLLCLLLEKIWESS